MAPCARPALKRRCTATLVEEMYDDFDARSLAKDIEMDLLPELSDDDEPAAAARAHVPQRHVALRDVTNRGGETAALGLWPLCAMERAHESLCCEEDELYRIECELAVAMDSPELVASLPRAEEDSRSPTVLRPDEPPSGGEGELEKLVESVDAVCTWEMKLVESTCASPTEPLASPPAPSPAPTERPQPPPRPNNPLEQLFAPRAVAREPAAPLEPFQVRNLYFRPNLYVVQQSSVMSAALAAAIIPSLQHTRRIGKKRRRTAV